jgi:cell division protein FtsQ
VPVCCTFGWTQKAMKKFWRILKKVLTITAVLSCAALFIIVLTSAIQKQKQLTCNNVEVKIDYDSGLAFLSEGEIKDHLNFVNGGNLIGKELSTIDFRKLEREVEKNPFADKAEVFVDQQQNIIVDVIQKRPILRILNSDGVGYYISEKNERIPLSDKFTSHVAIALGAVETHQSAQRDSSVQAALYKLIQYVRKDKFLNALVDQVRVNDNGEFDIIPKINGHFIRFGNADENMEEKFNRLKIFYKEGMEKVGWMKYKSIDLRYMNQVVCEKRDSVASFINHQ